MTQYPFAARARCELSVVMPVRNAMPYLDEAIQSILNQTYGDFEFVIGDDASTDGSSERLVWWAAQDSRIRLERRQSPSGPAGSANWVVQRSSGKYIARMDADDVAHPERLRRQIAILDTNPEAVMVACLWKGIDRSGSVVREPDYAGLLRKDPFKRPFAHGSATIRRSHFDEIGGYRQACDFWEDTDLFFRLSKKGSILVQTDPFYSYRYTANSNRLQVQPERLEKQLALKAKCLEIANHQGSYESVLESAEGFEAEHAIPISALQNRASIEMWAGQRSLMLLEWLGRGSRKHLLKNWPYLAFLIGAFASPSIMRWMLARKTHLANVKAQRTLAGKPYVRWS